MSDAQIGIPLHEYSKILLKNRIKKIKSNDFNFIFLGDSRVGEHGNIEKSVLAQLLRDAVKENPLFIFHGGDAVNRGNEKTQFRDFVDIVTGRNPDFPVPGIEDIPVFVAFGNHELDRPAVDRFDNFKTYIGSFMYSLLEMGLPLRYLSMPVINIRQTGEDFYEFACDEQNFLRKYLEEVGKSSHFSYHSSFLGMHVPPPIGLFTPSIGAFSVGLSSFLRTIDSKIRHVLVSHIHAFIQFKELVNDHYMTFTLSGRAGVQEIETFLPPEFIQKQHYVIVHVDNERKKITYTPVFPPIVT